MKLQHPANRLTHRLTERLTQRLTQRRGKRSTALSLVLFATLTVGATAASADHGQRAGAAKANTSPCRGGPDGYQADRGRFDKANANSPRRDATTINAKARIAEGINSGELTRREARVLKRKVKALNKARRLARRDGIVTWREAKALRAAERDLSKEIYQQKHDRQRNV